MNEYEVQIFVPQWPDGVGLTSVGEGYWNTVNRFTNQPSATEHRVALLEFYVNVRIIQRTHTVVEERIIE